MIEYIRGKIVSLTPATATLETAGGVGYLLNISLTAFTALEGKSEACLLVHEAIREDAWTLFGFIDNRERDLFRLLIGVAGIGANTARMILSSIPARDLEVVITTGDSSRLKAVKGIGAKTAERVIVDLRDKVKADVADLPAMAMGSTAMGQAYEEALAALVALGFPKPLSQKALKKVFDANPSAKVEDAIKRSLSML